MIYRIILCALVITIGCDSKKKPREIWAVGIPSNLMSIHAAQQEGQNWCWAASIQMVLSCQGISVPQHDIVTQSYGIALDAPGGPEEFIENLSVWCRTRSEIRHLRPQIIPGAPSITGLTKSLERNSPIIIAILTPGADVGHAVVVTAVVFGGTRSSPELERVIIRDPAPVFERSRGKRVLSPAEFSSTIYHIVLQ
jgi:hypothetical protein